MSQHDEIKIAIQEIVTILERRPPVHEAIIRQAIVLRLLYISGFDIWNIDCVSPEETNSGGFRPDFIIRLGRGGFAIELKASDTPLLPKHYQQTLNYIGTLGLRYAILTNGKSWVFLDERLAGRYEDREIFRLVLDREHQVEFVEHILKALDLYVWENDIFSMRSKQIANSISGNRDRGELIVFFLELYGAAGKAVYDSSTGTWTILAGSTALSRTKQYNSIGNGLQKRRARHMAEGKLIPRNDGLLEFTQDVVCSSATIAASEITGLHRNGWEH